jgi:hypothetical protein
MKSLRVIFFLFITDLLLLKMVHASARPRAALFETYLFSAGIAWWLQALQWW